MNRSPTTGRPSMRPRLGAAMLATGLLLAFAPSASAHAELVSSTPAANASLSSSPAEVSLTFSERVDGTTARVALVDATQRTIGGIGEVRVSDDALTVTATVPALDPGVYTVSYQVVSAVDGHATAGIFAFLVDPSGAEPAPTGSPTSSSPSVDAETIAARWLGLLGILVALGSLSMWWLAGRTGLREATSAATSTPPWLLVGAAAAMALVGTVLYLLLAARPIASIVDGFTLDPAAAFGWTPFAIAMRVALAGLLVAAIVAFLRPRPALAPAAVAIVLAVSLGGMSMAAHAAASGGPAFAALDWAHLVAVAAWLGGIPAAFVLARRARSAGASVRAATGAILRRHGRVALVAAPVVALTGIANSPLVIGEARDLVGSDYGNLVVAKATLLAVALGIGAVNHVTLRGRRRATIGALVAVELVAAVLAVGAAATMVTIQPAAARQDVVVSQSLPPAHYFGTAGPSHVHASVDLPTTGPQAYQVTITDVATGAPRDDVQRVYLVLTPPTESGLPAGERIELTPGATPGVYVAEGAYTPVEGDWGVEVVVRRRGALDEAVDFTVPIVSPAPPEVVPPPDSGVGVPAPLAALWPVLPPGPLAWLPVAAGLLALWVVGRSSVRGVPRGVLGGALAAVVLVGGLAAGTRALVTAANQPVGTPDASPIPTDAEALFRGEAIYLANCASCHGRDGDGAGPIRTLPPAGPLAEAVRRMSPAALGYRIAHGVAGTPMPAFAGTLTPTERGELVGYLRDRWPDE